MSEQKRACGRCEFFRHAIREAVAREIAAEFSRHGLEAVLVIRRAAALIEQAGYGGLRKGAYHGAGGDRQSREERAAKARRENEDCRERRRRLKLTYSLDEDDCG